MAPVRIPLGTSGRRKDANNLKGVRTKQRLIKMALMEANSQPETSQAFT